MDIRTAKLPRHNGQHLIYFVSMGEGYRPFVEQLK